MKTVPQYARKYTKLVKVGAFVEGPPAFQVKLTVGNQRFPLADPMDKVTAKWYRNQLALALYKLVAFETAPVDKRKARC